MPWSQLRLPISIRRKLRIHAGPDNGIAHLFALVFPHRSTLCNCSSVQASRSTDLTRLICVPIPRCIPEQLRPHYQLLCGGIGMKATIYRMQTKIPKFQLAHRGSGPSCNHQHLSSGANRLTVPSRSSTYACFFYNPHSSYFRRASTDS